MMRDIVIAGVSVGFGGVGKKTTTSQRTGWAKKV